MSSIYNAYIPGGAPYEKISEGSPPGSDCRSSSASGKSSGKSPGSPLAGLSGLLGKLGKLDSGDLLLLLILFLLLKEGEQTDWVLLLALAAVFFLDGDG